MNFLRIDDIVINLDNVLSIDATVVDDDDTVVVDMIGGYKLYFDGENAEAMKRWIRVYGLSAPRA